MSEGEGNSRFAGESQNPFEIQGRSVRVLYKSGYAVLGQNMGTKW